MICQTLSEYLRVLIFREWEGYIKCNVQYIFWNDLTQYTGRFNLRFYREDDEKRSLTGSKAESETDSMAEYGDTDPGQFTEDGSFIGKVIIHE